MNQFTIRVKHMGQSLIKWQNIVTPKLEHWVDKYKIVKYGCVLGIVLNSYFIYDGLVTAVVLTRVLSDVTKKREVFYKTVDNKREMVLALMEQLQGSRAQPSQLRT